ncbi:MAG: glycoside hydrolase family 36 protein [Dehalococcoidia bacterium]
MTAPVASGFARNGPWLQNEWLRIDARLADGSFSPVALATGFRPAERVHAAIDLLDGRSLRPGRTDYGLHPHEDALGKGRRITLTSRLPGDGASVLREAILYDDHPFAVLRAGLRNECDAPLDLAAIWPFVTPPEGRGRLRLASEPASWRIYRNGWQSWSPTMSFGGADRDVQSAPPVLSPEAPQETPGRFASDDVGVLYDPQTGRSLLAGVVSARDFLSQVLVDAPRRTLDVCCLADGLALAPGEEVWSERVLVDLVGTPQEQLERYGDALAREMGARVPSRQPSGWSSWYYFFTEVTEADVLRNLRFLEAHRRELPVDVVQIDDGYQTDIGDWLTINEKFPRGMAWLAREIKAAGFTAGIWLAPFLLAETSRTFAEHPEYVVRDDAGEPVLATENWQRRNFGLDSSHPGARPWLADLFHEVCEGWGYDYLKIDFLFAAALAGRRHDPSATRARAYRQALEAVRAGVGDGRFILGCGSLMAPSVGIFDGNRIGPDVAPFWRFLTRAERQRPRARARAPDDQLSAETAVRSTVNRWWMHGRLWANDPDCLLVRTDRTKLTLDEVRTIATAIGLSGGMVLTSDDLEKVPPERLAIVSMLLPVLPGSATPLDLMERDMPERFELALETASGPVRLVGLFNFTDEARDLRLPLPEGSWHAFELWEARYQGVVQGDLEFVLTPAHACRLVALRPVVGRPQVVGTTAHIGCGALDISDESWEASGLTLRVEAFGQGERTVVVACDGFELREARFAGEVVRAEQRAGIVSVRLYVEEAGELRFTFVNA